MATHVKNMPDINARTSNRNLIHPAWIALIRHCQAMGHGEIERIKIQDGVPVLIEKSVERIKLI